jgi:hypothetical protein
MKNLFGYIKLGRLNKPIADKINKKPADIYIEYNYLRHIEKNRGNYLTNLKLDALSYVKLIVDNYYEIRIGKGNALLLVMKMNNQSEEKDKREIVVMELQLIETKNVYIVKTAMPRIKFANDETVLFSK